MQNNDGSAARVLFNFSPSLPDYDVKLPNFTFYIDNTSEFDSLLLKLDIFLRNSIPGELAYF